MQALRAVAVLSVLGFHACPGVLGGYLGVDLFFVISGYVITGMLLKEIAATGSIKAVQFVRGRLRRLAPALAGITIFSAFAAALIVPPFGLQTAIARTGFASLAFVSNVELYKNVGDYFAPASDLNPFLHTWSLAVEEQIYLGVATIIASAVMLRGRVTSSGLVRGVTLLGAASLLLWATPVLGGSLRGVDELHRFLFYAPPARVWEFAVGTLLAVYVRRRRRSVSGSLRFPWPALVGLAGFIFLVALARKDWATFPALLTAVAACGLIGSLWRPCRRTHRVLGALAFVGDRSYSLYLWHWPLIVIARVLWPSAGHWGSAGAALFAFIPAHVSHELLEKPFRSHGRGSAGIVVGRLRSVGVLLVLAAVALTVLEVGGRAAWWRADLRALASDVTPMHEDVRLHCDSPEPLSERAARCTVNPGMTGAPVYLLGDSNAGHFAEGLTIATAHVGRSLVLGTLHNCPFLNAEPVGTTTPAHSCIDFYEKTIAWLEHRPASTVILASASSAYIEQRNVGMLDGYTGTVVAGYSAKTDLWTRNLELTAGLLMRAGHQVLIVHVVPYFDGWKPLNCSLAASLAGRRCGETRTLADVARGQRRAYVAESAAAAATRAGILDLRNVLCRRDVCSTDWDGGWLYKDAAHLTVRGSRLLAPVFEAALRRF